MKKTGLTQIKGLDIKELKLKAKSLREEIANLILDKNMKKLKDLKMVAKKKKELARVLTVMKQKEQLSVLSGQLSDKSQSVVSSSVEKLVTEKQTTGKPESENRKPKTENRKAGGKK